MWQNSLYMALDIKHFQHVVFALSRLVALDHPCLDLSVYDRLLFALEKNIKDIHDRFCRDSISNALKHFFGNYFEKKSAKMRWQIYDRYSRLLVVRKESKKDVIEARKKQMRAAETASGADDWKGNEASFKDVAYCALVLFEAYLEEGSDVFLPLFSLSISLFFCSLRFLFVVFFSLSSYFSFLCLSGCLYYLLSRLLLFSFVMHVFSFSCVLAAHFFFLFRFISLLFPIALIYFLLSLCHILSHFLQESVRQAKIKIKNVTKKTERLFSHLDEHKKLVDALNKVKSREKSSN